MGANVLKINNIGQLAWKILNYNNFNENAYNKIIITRITFKDYHRHVSTLQAIGNGSGKHP